MTLPLYSHAIIFGPDDRAEVNSGLTPMEAMVNAATATMIKKDNLSAFISLEEKSNVCSDQKFSNQNAIGECTAFLVAPNLLMSAGHCMYVDGNDYKTTCDNMAFAFDFEVGVNNLSDVVECEEVIFHRWDPEESSDYALIKLKETIGDRPYLKLSKNIYKGQELLSVGSGLGLPKKISRTGKVQKYKNKHLNYDLDLFGGNSGSPIVDKPTGEVIGVHIYGSPFDLIGDSCQKYNNTCKNNAETNFLCQFGGGYPIKDMAPYVMKKYNLINLFD